ncbi:NlpC/P60 family protein [Streptomyces albireticuli]|nr:NlpC/P60 family protein [Streptomyces albireticuli]MCD9143897.1 C40 family peptidase [Streptomyces albireticuli]MCD9161672.1 C40 family peptidase [Streptomyces albireticuli]MCD9192014.1 C40 family peptidase [Streptomyces albireticuli]
MDSRQVMALAAGAARRGLALKVGLPLVAALMAFLILVGMMAGFGGGSASAAGCEQPGLPADDGEYGDGRSGGDETGGAGKELRARQVAHAKIIDEVAKEGKLPGRATLIALMTGLAESQLENLKGGDRDSVGIFQQRPSTGWGTPAQINDIKYSTRMFLFGGDSGDPPGLTDIAWENLSLNDAAQKVQRSGFPNAYGPKETQARSIAREAGIDLERAGENHPAQPGRNGSNGGGGDRKDDGKGDKDPDEPQDCEQRGSGEPGKPGEPFHDGNAGWPNGVKNPLSTADAIRKARAEADSHRSQWYQKCLAFTSIMYGWSFSGTNYAIDHYQVEMPKDMRHDGDRNPPPGALMFWDTGHRAGHVAIYLGDGKIASNDIVTPGEISVVPATDIETKWRAKYLGWSPPYYPKGG